MLSETEQGWIDEARAILEGTTLVLPTKLHLQAIFTAHRQLQAERDTLLQANKAANLLIAEGADAAQDIVKQLMQERDQLQTERDDLKEITTTCCENTRAGLIKVEQERDRLRQVVETYGQHRYDCDALKSYSGQPRPCDCGLDAARGRTR